MEKNTALDPPNFSAVMDVVPPPNPGSATMMRSPASSGMSSVKRRVISVAVSTRAGAKARDVAENAPPTYGAERMETGGWTGPATALVPILSAGEFCSIPDAGSVTRAVHGIVTCTSVPAGIVRQWPTRSSRRTSAPSPPPPLASTHEASENRAAPAPTSVTLPTGAEKPGRYRMTASMVCRGTLRRNATSTPVGCPAVLLWNASAVSEKTPPINGTDPTATALGVGPARARALMVMVGELRASPDAGRVTPAQRGNATTTSCPASTEAPSDDPTSKTSAPGELSHAARENTFASAPDSEVTLTSRPVNRGMFTRTVSPVMRGASKTNFTVTSVATPTVLGAKATAEERKDPPTYGDDTTATGATGPAAATALILMAGSSFARPSVGSTIPADAGTVRTTIVPASTTRPKPTWKTSSVVDWFHAAPARSTAKGPVTATAEEDAALPPREKPGR